MDEVTNLFNRFTNFMDQNIRGVQIGCYSIAVIGLTVALRKVRPLSRFKRPSDIPNHFIQEKRELTGYVERIEPKGALLMVKHKPLIQLPFAKSEKELPVKISGVNVSGLGISWLQTVVAGNEIKFYPIKKDKDWVHCEVLLLQVVKDKKQQLVEKQINIGESLIKIGFAEIEKPLKEDPNFQTYFNRLHSAELYFLRKKLGLKYYIKPTKRALSQIANKLNELIHRSTKTVKQVPRLTAI